MATYYCDYANGDDGVGDGSSGAPWKTIAYAVGQVAENDTLLLRGSNSNPATYYRDTNNLTISKAAFIIGADTGHTPALVGTHEYIAWNKTAGQTNVFETVFTPSACHFCFNGSQFLTSVGSVALCDSTTNSFFPDLPNDLLYVNIGGDAPTSIEAYDHGNQYALIVTGDGVTLDGLTVQYQFMALDVRGDDQTVTGCTLRYWYNFSSEGGFALIQVDGSNNTITGCRFQARPPNPSGNYCVDVKATATNTTISNCLSQYAQGFYIRGGSVVISSNTLRSGRIRAIGSAALTVSDCAFTLEDDVGFHSNMELRDTVSLTMLRCTFYWTLTPTAGTYYAVVLHNGGASNIYHSVFYGIRRTTGTISRCLYIAPDTGTASITVKNSAFVNCQRGINYVSGTITYDLDYLGFFDNDSNYDNVGAADQGANDVTADPLFTDDSNNDFTLTSSSPYIDAGVAVAGINDDYNGSAPDIGRYETEPDTGSPAAMLMGWP